MRHDSGLAGDPGPLGLYEDAARRVSDTMTMHLLADRDGNANRWFAFKLSDGTSDGVVYDNPIQAADAQLYYKACGYIQIHLSGITPQGASALLNYYRKTFDAGNVPPSLVAYEQAMAQFKRRLS